MWWTLAAAAIPYVVSAMQKKPSMPGAPNAVSLPDRSAYVNQLLDTAYNPNSSTWLLASKEAEDQVARALGRQGAMGSSVGNQTMSNVQTALAAKWLEDAVSRQEGALNTAIGYDRAQAGQGSENSRDAYNYAMDAYKNKVAENTAQVQGISNLVNAGVGAYNQQQYQDRYDALMAQYGRAPAAYYGIPGYQTQNYMPAAYNYQGTMVG